MNFDSQETIPDVYSPAYVLLLSLIQELFFQNKPLLCYRRLYNTHSTSTEILIYSPNSAISFYFHFSLSAET